MFTIGYFVGLLGLLIFSYLFFARIWSTYLSTKFSLAVGTDVFRFSELSFTPTVLNVFWFFLLFLGVMFTFIGLSVTREKDLRNKNPISLLLYLTFYLAIFPIMLIYSIYKLFRGNYSW
jgi:hypothetical protein